MKNKGLLILKKNYFNSFGEIDLICLDKDELVFVEVKTRYSDKSGYPEESVTQKKIEHIANTANHFIVENNLEDKSWRVDVIAIRMHTENKPEICHFEAIDMPEEFCYIDVY